LKALERVSFSHVQTLRECPTLLNRNLSDKAQTSHPIFWNGRMDPGPKTLL
jgi:hypothetical protein